MGFFDKLFNSMNDSGGKTVKTESVPAPAESELPAAKEEPQEITIRFGSPDPVPYNTEYNGQFVSLALRYSGIAKIRTENAEEVKKGGGLEAMKELFLKDIRRTVDFALIKAGSDGVPVNRLPSYSSKIVESVTEKLNKSWSVLYGAQISSLSLNSVSLTEESQKTLDALRKQVK